ncbi:MAG: ABC transporter substrate-binding protein [Sulfolobales archaeon]
MRISYVAGLIITLLVGLLVGYYLSSTLLTTSTGAVSETLVVVDSLGRYVKVSNVSRVVSLAPSITEVLFALGLEGSLVGVDDFSNYPPKLLELINAGKIKYVGGWWSPDIEKVVSLRPSLVIADGGVYRQVALEGKFKELGVDVVYLKGSGCRDVDDVINDIKLVGMLLNATNKANELSNTIKGKVGAVSEKVSSVMSSKPKVLFLAGPPSEGLYSAGGNTYVSYLIEVSGGINIVRDLMGWPLLSYEKILTENPDLIIVTLMGPSTDINKLREEISKTPLADVKAYKKGNIYVVSGEAGDILVRPGPRVYAAVEFLSQILHPELFGGVSRGDVIKVLT